MSRIRKRDTKPELQVRSLIHRMGYRFRVHCAELPGTPDIVLPRHRKIVLVHGCFWHVHTCRPGRIRPAVNAAYWKSKRQRNVQRDERVIQLLQNQGWGVCVIWECELKQLSMARDKLARFLKKRHVASLKSSP